MPVFIAFAAFMLLLFGQRIGLSLGPWVITQGPVRSKEQNVGTEVGRTHRYAGNGVGP
jgi:hypothetical protein